jgi:chromosome segregation ATPase
MAEKHSDRPKSGSSTAHSASWTAPKGVRDILRSSNLREREIKEVEAHLYRKDMDIWNLEEKFRNLEQDIERDMHKKDRVLRDRERQLENKQRKSGQGRGNIGKAEVDIEQTIAEIERLRTENAELREGMEQLRAEMEDMQVMTDIHNGLLKLGHEYIEKKTEEQTVMAGERECLRAEKEHYANESRKLQVHIAEQNKTIQSFIDKLTQIVMAPTDQASAIANEHMAQQTLDIVQRLQRDVAERDDQIIQYEQGKEKMLNQVKDYWNEAQVANERAMKAESLAQEQQAKAAQAQTMVAELQKGASEAKTAAFEQLRQVEGIKDDLHRKQETIDELVKKYPTTVAHVPSMQRTKERRRIKGPK